MRYVFLIVLLAAQTVCLSAAEAATADVHKDATGHDQVIADSVGLCSIPNAEAPSHQQFPIEPAVIAFGYSLCKEYSTYEVTVTGTKWGTSQSQSGPKTMSYAVSPGGQQVLMKVESKKAADGTYYVDDAEWKEAAKNAIEKCRELSDQFSLNTVPYEKTKCFVPADTQ